MANKYVYTHSSKTPPSFTKYPRKGVVGIDWNLVNKDRRQLGLRPLPYTTQFADSITGEL